MYTTFRMMQAKMGQQPEAIRLGAEFIGHINDAHGTEWRLAAPIGSHANCLAASAVWETVGAYHEWRTKAVADTALLDRMQAIAATLDVVEDTIARVLMPPGDRKDIAALATASMHMPKVAEAIAFGIEVSEWIEAKRGFKVGLANATNGLRNRVMWISYHDDVNTGVAEGEALEADPEYLEFFKRSGDLYIDGTFEQSMWERVV